MERDAWLVHCLAENAKTPISPYVRVASQGMLIRLLRYVGASDSDIAEVEEKIRRWSRGSIDIDLADGRRNLLKIRPPFNGKRPVLAV
jgi:hypothetical protein